MKIFIIPIEEKFRPKKQRFKYPKHNSDYGVEQDFYEYILNKKDMLTKNSSEADWFYLPIFWTRWHLNHNYGKEGLDELQKEVDSKIIDIKKTFTICQYDDGPIIKLGGCLNFLSSRKDSVSIDIPLLSSEHREPFFKKKKKYIASFTGRIGTHSIRSLMAQELSNKKDIFIKDGNFSVRFFVKTVLESYTSLCPRGYGGSSFRFFESMQLGVAPILIGDLDTRPFKKFIDWDKISFYRKNTEDLYEFLSSLKKEDLLFMGKNAKKIYEEQLAYQKWCDFILKELDERNKQ
jgi:hypothetical protein